MITFEFASYPRLEHDQVRELRRHIDVRRFQRLRHDGSAPRRPAAPVDGVIVSELAMYALFEVAISVFGFETDATATCASVWVLPFE